MENASITVPIGPPGADLRLTLRVAAASCRVIGMLSTSTGSASASAFLMFVAELHCCAVAADGPDGGAMLWTGATRFYLAKADGAAVEAFIANARKQLEDDLDAAAGAQA